MESEACDVSARILGTESTFRIVLDRCFTMFLGRLVIIVTYSNSSQFEDIKVIMNCIEMKTLSSTKTVKG